VKSFFVVDLFFIVQDGKSLIGIEVKSKTRKNTGLLAFKKLNPKASFCYIDFENYMTFEKKIPQIFCRGVPSSKEFTLDWAQASRTAPFSCAKTGNLFLKLPSAMSGNHNKTDI
jgi:hypothetical protein